MMETDLPFPPAASRAEGEEDVGQEVTQSWVKPLIGEEGFGHGGQERRLVMPKLRLARQRGRGKSVAGREMACTMLWGPEGRTQAKWNLGETWSGREEGRELGWLQRPCCLCERDWAAFRGWRGGLEGLGQGRSAGSETGGELHHPHPPISGSKQLLAPSRLSASPLSACPTCWLPTLAGSLPSQPGRQRLLNCFFIQGPEPDQTSASAT